MDYQTLGEYAVNELQKASGISVTQDTPPIHIRMAILKRFEMFAKEWEHILQVRLQNDVTVKVFPLTFLDPTMQEIFDSLKQSDDGILIAKRGQSTGGHGYNLNIHFTPRWVMLDGKAYRLDGRKEYTVTRMPSEFTPSLETVPPAPIAKLETTTVRASRFGVGYPLIEPAPESRLLDTIALYAVDWMHAGKAQEDVNDQQT